MAAPMSSEVRKVKQDAFLAALATSGITRIAADAANIHRSTHDYWLENDVTYAIRAKVALEDAADVVEAEMLRRGMVGMRQFQFHKGKPIKWKGPDGNGPEVHYYEDKRSDACLIMTAKARRPEKFRERHEVTGAGGGPLAVVHANIGMARMIHSRPDLAEQLRQLADDADAQHDRTDRITDAVEPGDNGQPVP